MRKLLALGTTCVVMLGIVALLAPAPTHAQLCVQCPVLEERSCPPCTQFVPGDCDHCASCQIQHRRP